MIQPILRPVIKAANDRLRGGSPIVLPYPPLLDLDFVGRPSLTYPGLPAITFTRADATTCATYRDATGTRRTAVADEPRFDHDVNGNPLGLLMERQQTNFLLNSLAPVTQTTASLSTGRYTLWVEGSGSAEVSGNTATITGAGTATQGTPVFFTVTVSGTVDVTVTGTLTAFQVENFHNETSVVVTEGTTATRAADSAYMSASAFGFNSARGTLFIQALATQREDATDSTAQVYCSIDDDSNTNRIVLFRSSGGTLLGKVRAVVATSGSNKFQADTAAAIAKGSTVKIAIGYESGNTACAVNGTILTPTLNNAFDLSALTTLRLGSQTPVGSGSANSPIARVRYWPAKLPDSALQALTL